MSQQLTLSVYVPAIGQQELLDECVEHLSENVKGVVPIYVIDNGSKVPLTSSFANVIRNDENRGMVGSLKDATAMCRTDILVYQHSDLFIYEGGWDEKVIRAFESDPKLAALGIVGAEIADPNGGRSNVWCAFRDWHVHGKRPVREVTPVALLDGCWMAFRRSALEGLDWDSLESNGYLFSYDKDLTLTLTMKSLHVGVINLDSQHIGGQTSCREEFNETLKNQGSNLDSMYRESERRYIDKWKPCLPVRVMQDWTVHVGRK